MFDLTWYFKNCMHECATFEEYVEMVKNYDNFVRSEMKVTGNAYFGFTILEYQKVMRFINDESKTEELCDIVNKVIERIKENNLGSKVTENDEFTILECKKVAKIIEDESNTEELGNMVDEIMRFIEDESNTEEFLNMENEIMRFINDKSKTEELGNMADKVTERIEKNSIIYDREKNERLSNDKCIEYVKNIINNITIN